MLDYRAFFKSKLADLKQRRADIDNEIEKAMMVISGLDEADSESSRSTSSEIEDPQLSFFTGKLVDDVVQILKISGKMMTTQEVERHAAIAHKVAKGSVYTSLSRLKDRGVVVKIGRLWGLEGRDDSP